MAYPPPESQKPSAAPRAWLDHIPGHRRGVVANWFHESVRKGAHQPALVLQAVRQTCSRRRRWGDETDACAVLSALATDPAGALAYAQSVIAYESLPSEARQRVKAERTIAFLKQGMKGKPATEPQLAYLRKLGYTGAPPVDRAAASALIDALQQRRGRGEG